MNEFKKRKDSAEAAFSNEQEVRYKNTMRGMRRGGLRAAELLGLSGDEAAAYAQDIVALAVALPEAAARKRAIEKMQADGVKLSEAELEAMLQPVAEA